jgi:hypothetical protein
VNTFDFRGRMRGRALSPGDYLVSISNLRRPRSEDAVAAVRVVSDRRSVPLRAAVARAACSSRPLSAFLAAVQGSAGATAEGESTGTGRPTGSVFLPPTPRFDVETEALGVLPPLGPGPDSGDEPFDAFPAFAILALVGAFLGALVTLVARFLAGDWNP